LGLTVLREFCKRKTRKLQQPHFQTSFKVYQYTNQFYETSYNKRARLHFVSRLHWHCHFMQKFENDCQIEFENINKDYDSLVKPKNEIYIKAWQEGKTGVPIVDACM
jgi:deoxyribodipyrimidine photo-lyase